MPASRHVDKASFLNAIACPTRGWLTRTLKHATPPNEADQLRMEEGQEIGRRAQRLFPEGVLVPWQKTAAAVKQTSGLMADQKVPTIFEATFCADDYVAKADILLREKRGWHLLEVKSGINVKQELVEDLAYTVMVARRSGGKITRASLLLLSGTYQLGMDESDLFVQHDCTDEVWKIIDQFEDSWDSAAAATLAKQRPKPKLQFVCRSCEYFSTDCLGKDARDHVFELPRLSERAFDRLAKQNITAIADIPNGFPLTAPQERVRKAIVTGKPVVSKKELGRFLETVNWPAFYLDFETVKSSIPLYAGVRPHEQIPTQYSIHVCDAPGKKVAHRQFLADPAKDGRRALAEQLLADLDGTGKIIVYSSFEKTTLNQLGKLFDDLQPKLARLIDRLFDLEKAFRDWFCHPDFHGRTSIKVTLPALIDDLSYKGLPIADGDTAVAKYARMARGEIVGKAAADVRRDLLAYCGQDTLAMVKLHEKLLTICRQ